MKTKTETQRAKHNIKEAKDLDIYNHTGKEHLASLKRELDFIEVIVHCPKGAKCCKLITIQRWEDIKQAIKLYSENGIK